MSAVCDDGAWREGYEDRFGGVGRLYGVTGMRRLAGAHVAVVGVGGVGSWVVEALARSGVGRLTLIDLDDVCVTNTNRQLPALSGTVGQPKVEVLARRVREIDPGCEVAAVTAFLGAGNVEDLLGSGLSMVVDAVDGLGAKAVILDWCRRHEVPVVTSGGAGGRRDPTQVRVGDLGRAGGDPLLLQLRRKLRREFGWPGGVKGRAVDLGVTAVYSAERRVYPLGDGSCGLEPEAGGEKGLRLDCAAGFGAATFVTGTFGFAMASVVVHALTKD
jgi:tRNA A37 threonylcarbamoyladenosine dehydratase